MCLAMNPDKLVGDQLQGEFLELQLQRPSRQSNRSHHAYEPHHGSGRGRDWRSLRRPQSSALASRATKLFLLLLEVLF